MEALRIALNSMKAAEKILASQGYILRWQVTIETDRGLKETGDTPAEIAGQTGLNPEQPQKPAEQRSEKAEENGRPVTALCTTDAVHYLGITIAGLYDRIKSGRIPAHGKPGNRWFLTEELDQYLESRKRPAVIRSLRQGPDKKAKGARG